MHFKHGKSLLPKRRAVALAQYFGQKTLTLIDMAGSAAIRLR